MAENKKRFLLAYREQLQEADKREKKPSLLLHACCAPCSSAVLEELSKHFSLQICYYNPNIQPKGEYDLRFSETARLAFAINPEIKMMDVPYEPERWQIWKRGAHGVRSALRCGSLKRQEWPKRAVSIILPPR